MENVEQWLNSPPLETEIKTKDKGKYIPYAIIVEKLNKLCKNDWGTRKFNETYVKIGNHWLVSGNIEVIICYKDDKGDYVSRILSGGASFFIIKGKKASHHPTATVKSLAIMNAVKPLGRQFGWLLNGVDEDTEVPEAPTEKVVKPDQEKETLIVLIDNADTKAKLLSYRSSAEKYNLLTHYNKKLKQLTGG